MEKPPPIELTRPPTPPEPPIYRKATVGEHWTSLSKNARRSIVATAVLLILTSLGYLGTQRGSDDTVAKPFPPGVSVERNTDSEPSVDESKEAQIRELYLTMGRELVPYYSDSQLMRFRNSTCDSYAAGMTDDDIIAILQEEYPDFNTFMDLSKLTGAAKGSCPYF